MSLSAISISPLPNRSAQRSVAEEETPGLFDLVAAAAAAQVVDTKGLGQLTVCKPQSLNDQGTSLDASPALTASVHGAQPEPAMNVSHAEAPSCAPSIAHEPDTVPHSSARANDSYAIRHGTLPAIVSGQLVELALLRERRPSNSAAPTRRLSMVLEAAATLPVTVSAHVEDDCLVVHFSGAARADAMTSEDRAHEAYTSEVQALARRLGWKFTDIRWESTP